MGFALVFINVFLAIVVNAWDAAASREDRIDLYEQNTIICEVESLLWLFKRNSEKKDVYIIFAQYVEEEITFENDPTTR